MSWAGVFGKFRTVAPKFAGYATSTLVAVAAKKGYDLSAVQAAAIVALGGDVLSTVIGAVTRMNPNGANAPSMVRTEPLAPPLTELEVPTPIDIPADNAERMRAAFGPPNPLIAANAAKMAEINAGRRPLTPEAPPAPPTYAPDAVCGFCTGENGAHFAWCSAVGGSGVAPSGFFDNTQKINHDWLRKVAKSVGAAVEPVPTPEPEKSRILKPKPNAAPEPAPKSRARKKNAPSDVVKVARRATDAPQYSEGDPRGFADYVPTGKDLPKNISPRPRLSKNDKGVL